jgi:hypothetical protein
MLTRRFYSQASAVPSRDRVVRIAVVAVLAATTAVSIGSSVDAAVKQTSYFTYVTKSDTAVTRKQTAKRAPCPAGTTVLGGGVYTGGSGLNDEVASSAPYDGPDADRVPDDGWVGEINAGSSDRSMTTYAICAPFSGIEYRKNDFSALAGNQRRATVRCPEGTRSYGGGVLTKGSSTDVTLAISWPGGFKEASAMINNLSEKKVDATVYAICWKVEPDYAYVTGYEAAPGQSAFSYDCNDDYEHVAAGGAMIEGDLQDEIASLIPIDTGSDEDDVPDDAWRVWFNNGGGGGDQAVDLYSACMP